MRVCLSVRRGSPCDHSRTVYTCSLGYQTQSPPLPAKASLPKHMGTTQVWSTCTLGNPVPGLGGPPPSLTTPARAHPGRVQTCSLGEAGNCPLIERPSCFN